MALSCDQFKHYDSIGRLMGQEVLISGSIRRSYEVLLADWFCDHTF